MRYYICSNDKYLNSGLCIVAKENAYLWKSRIKAEKVLSNLPYSMKDYSFEVKPQLEYDDSMLNLDNFSNIIETFYNTYISEDSKLSLANKLSELDRKVIDIEHAIEFNRANVVEGYKYYKLLHDTLVERRKCKNDLQKIQVIDSALSFTKATSLVGKLNDLSVKVYTPRVLNELFEEG